MNLILIRHGKTNGNLHKRYIGVTDEALCEQGIQELRQFLKEGKYTFPGTDLTDATLLVSPLKRCIETATLLFPDRQMHIVNDFKECDFGEFENKNYAELADDARYQAFIDSNGTLPFPGGESQKDFKERIRQAALQTFSELDVRNCICIVHGGTIMSLLETFALPKKNFYAYQIKNGEGFLCTWENSSIYIKGLI